MKRLKNLHEKKDAVLISGGPSAISLLPKLKLLNKNRFVTFLESKALTHQFLQSEIIPDYFLLPHPEKAKDNSFQNFVYQSIKVNVPIKFFLKNEFHSEVNIILENKEKYFESWNPIKGPHKKIRYRDHIFLKDSPFDLLNKIPETKIITEKQNFINFYGNMKVSALKNEFYYIKFNDKVAAKSFSNYINLSEKDGDAFVNQNAFTNTAAISTFPIMKYMGINNIYLIGFDGTMFGTFENNADKLFKSRLHFYAFIFLCRRAFSHNFSVNYPIYLRPKSDLFDVDELLEMLDFEIFRLKGSHYETAEFMNMKEISVSELLSL